MRASHSTETRRTDRQTNRQTKGQTDGKSLLSSRMSATVNLVVRPFKAYRWLLLPRAGISSLFQLVSHLVIVSPERGLLKEIGGPSFFTLELDL